MKIFGFPLHRDPDPWRNAPPWAIELRQLSVRILATTELALEETEEIEHVLTEASHIQITLGTPRDKET